MIDDREYLNPLRAMKEHYSLPIHIVIHRLSYLNRVDVQFSLTVPCTRHHRSLCVSMVSGCEVMSSKIPDKRSQDVDNIPKTTMAFFPLVLLTRDIQVPEVVEVIDQPVVEVIE